VFKKLMGSALVLGIVAVVAYIIAWWLDLNQHKTRAEAEVDFTPDLQHLKYADEGKKAYLEERIEELAKEEADEIVARWKAKYGKGS